MKRALTHSILIAMMALFATACNNGGGGGGGPAPTAEETPEARWQRQQQEAARQQGANGQVWNRSFQKPQFGRSDIASGRVIGRQFGLVSGWVLERGNDNCYPKKGGNYEVFFPISRANAEILMTFDGAGNLLMKVANESGEYRSQVPLQYVLPGGERVIRVMGPAQATPNQQVPGVMLTGFPSASYVELQNKMGYLAAKKAFFAEGRKGKFRGNLEAEWAKADMGIAFFGGPTGGYGGWGFDPNSPGDQPGVIAQGQVPSYDPAQIQNMYVPGVHTAGSLSMHFSQGPMDIIAETAAPASPRHLTRLILWNLTYEYTRIVKGDKNVCTDRGVGYIKAYLQ